MAPPRTLLPAGSVLAQAKAAKLETLRALQAEATRRERARLSQLDVFGLLGYVPTPKQELFHAAEEFSVLYGGSAGGGKSRALVMDALRKCVQYPGIRVGAFRRTYPELRESLLAELAQVGYAEALGASWSGSSWELRFGNGSTIVFRYAESLKDATRVQGGQYQLLMFDEMTLLLPDVVQFLESRLRSGRADIPVLGVRASSNPGGPGHGFVKERFITATSQGTKVVTDRRNRSVRFIPARLSDNPHVNPEYQQDLQALDPKMRAAFLDGNWDVFAGMVFAEWNYDRHVIAPTSLPAEWRRYVGIDYGYTAPFAVVWSAVDNDGRLWVYRDLSRTQVIERDQARMILDAQGDDEHITMYAADPSMWAKAGEALPVASIYQGEGVGCEPANNDRILGWHRIHSFLSEGPACGMHRDLGWETCPRVHIFSTCTELIRTLPALPHAMRGNPEDADTASDDHLPDAFRYLCMSIGVGAEFVLLDPAPDTTFSDLLGDYRTAGAYAFRPSEADDLFADSEVEPGSGFQPSPFT